MNRSEWAEQHLGVAVDLGGAPWTIASTDGAVVVLEDEDGRKMRVRESAVRRAYVAQNAEGLET
jgi:hypothetical protein